MNAHTTRKRRWVTIALALISVVVLVSIFSTTALATTCPFGEVDCEYPGDCSRYIDTNGDGICDLSQDLTESDSTSSSTSDSESTDPLAAATTDDTHSGGGRGKNRGESLISPTEDHTASASAATTTVADGAADSGGFSLLTRYYISPIAIAFLLVYAISFFLYKTKRMKIATHRKIWNVLLLATFLITGIFGLILTIQLDYALPFSMPVNLLFWHVEAGIVMTLISLFHIGWHFKYYAKMLRTSRNKARSAEARERAYAGGATRREQVAGAPQYAYAPEPSQPGWEPR